MFFVLSFACYTGEAFIFGTWSTPIMETILYSFFYTAKLFARAKSVLFSNIGFGYRINEFFLINSVNNEQ